MRSYWLAIFTLSALIGLGILQWQWLKAAIALEQSQLEREVTLALWQLDRQTQENRALRFGLLSLQRYQMRQEASPDSLQEAVWLRLDSLAGRILHGRGIRMDYSLDVLTGGSAVSLLPDIEQTAKIGAAPTQANREMRGPIQQACDCQIYLMLQLKGDPLPFLLGRLWVLLLLAVVFFLLLALSFMLLWRGIRREQRLSQTKNDFINHLTHEMKTPVFSISLLGKLLRQSIQQGQPQQSEAFLDRIEAENSQLKTQVEKILELASLEQPEYALEKAPLELTKALKKWGHPFEQRAAAVSGSLQYDFPKQAVTILADADHLENAVQNLLDNALKYGGQPPQILLSLVCSEGWAGIQISDNGCGIPKADQEQIFEKFYRLDKDRRSSTSGFGLGLSYSRQIAALHGGQLRLLSSDENGTTFELKLKTH
jgi:two-component system phosphate regulon sensor histidine kinase PhoR